MSLRSAPDVMRGRWLVTLEKLAFTTRKLEADAWREGLEPPAEAEAARDWLDRHQAALDVLALDADAQRDMRAAWMGEGEIFDVVYGDD